MIEGIKIVLMSVVAAMLYGVAHGQVTTRVCVEYFTAGTTSALSTDTPALVQGILATWWTGLVLGIPLALAARMGSKPKTRAATLRKPMGFLLIRVAVYSTLGGLAGYYAAKQGWVRAMDTWAHQVVPDQEAALVAVVWAHWTAYGSAAVEGAAFCIRTWRRRGAPARASY